MATVAVAAEPGAGAGAGALSALRDALRSRRLILGLVVVGFFVLVAAFGPLFVGDPNHEYTDALNAGPSAAHWFGTTNIGQDIFAQTVDATRPTLLIGAAAGLIATAISVVIGIGGGYLGGIADELLALLTNVALVIPTLPLVIVASKFMGDNGLTPTIFVIAFTSWAASARVLRGQTLSLRNRDYVLAARALDEPRWRIILVELLPNEMPIIVSQFTFSMVFAILGQAGLAFLGLQSADMLTWGNILYFAQNAQALDSGQWWWFAPSGLCIAVFGAGLALINFGLDELLNPRLRVYRPSKARAERSS
ncbi:ABC transporter permease [Actinospica durhamensis]|uniref:ABC transporter permease n=1 Tax=Actinospica durhamensis TaxID=1508375 RepID=A0A941EWN1_9ACTN|nr:ABC transporter permease [Actinospica durhamensis]MBR7839215.1 ABC transporter permease [Actinospica durhamensis]